MEKICLHCELPFRVKPSHAPIKFYCSKSCMGEHYRTRLRGEANPNFRNAGERTCETCQRVFTAYSKTRRFCSQACYHVWAKPFILARHELLRGQKPTCEACGRLMSRTRRHVLCRACRPRVERRPRRVRPTCKYPPKPKPRPIVSCIACQRLMHGNGRWCVVCRLRGVHLVPKPTSICTVCQDVVQAPYRKYCDKCWGVVMSQRRGTPRRVDANHWEIVHALKEAGCGVIDASGVGGGMPDLVVCDLTGKIHLMEIKVPKAKLNKRQRQWHDEWRGPRPSVVTSVEEALRAVGILEPNMGETSDCAVGRS